jgi:hypothetical protein
VSIAIRTPATIGETLHTALLVAVERSCSRSCGKCRTRGTVLTWSRPPAGGQQTEASHPLPNTPSTASTSSPKKEKSVTHVSGTICYLCVGSLTESNTSLPSLISHFRKALLGELTCESGARICSAFCRSIICWNTSPPKSNWTYSARPTTVTRTARCFMNEKTSKSFLLGMRGRDHFRPCSGNSGQWLRAESPLAIDEGGGLVQAPVYRHIWPQYADTRPTRASCNSPKLWSSSRQTGTLDLTR